MAQNIQIQNTLRTFVSPVDLDEALKPQREQFDALAWMEPLVVELQKQMDLRHLIPYVAHGVSLMRRTTFEEAMASIWSWYPPSVVVNAVAEGVFHVQYHDGTRIPSNVPKDNADSNGINETITVIKQMCERL